MKFQPSMNIIATLALLIALLGIGTEVQAQRRPIRIGGPNGVVIGGGQGVRIGGFNGVQFGAGRGARFGPPGRGVQLGGGQGLRIDSIPLRNYGETAPRMAYPNPAPVPLASLSNSRVLGLPASAEEPFEYRLNGTLYRLKPGREINLKANQRWTVTFSPGNQKPDRSVSIDQPGRYLFTQSESGWDLVRQKSSTASVPPDEPQAISPTTMDKASGLRSQRKRTERQPKSKANSDELRSVLDTKPGKLRKGK